MVFIHKSNFQNELLRLNRHNKFVTELMTQMEDVGIQGPLRVDPGGSREYPMYWAGNPQPPPYGPGNPKDHQQDDGPSMRSTIPRHSVSVRSSRSQRAPTSNDAVLAGFHIKLALGIVGRVLYWVCSILLQPKICALHLCKTTDCNSSITGLREMLKKSASHLKPGRACHCPN